MRRLVVPAGLGIAAFAVLTGARPGVAVLAFDVLVVYLGALAVAWLGVRVGRSFPRAERSAIQVALAARRPDPGRPDELIRIERQVELGVANAGDFHATLAPFLRGIAAQLLAVRGVDLEREPERARALLGDEPWLLLRDDVPRPDDPFTKGVPRASLDGLIASLERIGA